MMKILVFILFVLAPLDFLFAIGNGIPEGKRAGLTISLQQALRDKNDRKALHFARLGARFDIGELERANSQGLVKTAKYMSDKLGIDLGELSAEFKAIYRSVKIENEKLRLTISRFIYDDLDRGQAILSEVYDERFILYKPVDSPGTLSMFDVAKRSKLDLENICPIDGEFNHYIDEGDILFIGDCSSRNYCGYDVSKGLHDFRSFWRISAYSGKNEICPNSIFISSSGRYYAVITPLERNSDSGVRLDLYARNDGGAVDRLVGHIVEESLVTDVVPEENAPFLQVKYKNNNTARNIEFVSLDADAYVEYLSKEFEMLRTAGEDDGLESFLSTHMNYRKVASNSRIWAKIADYLIQLNYRKEGYAGLEYFILKFKSSWVAEMGASYLAGLLNKEPDYNVISKHVSVLEDGDKSTFNDLVGRVYRLAKEDGNLNSLLFVVNRFANYDVAQMAKQEMAERLLENGGIFQKAWYIDNIVTDKSTIKRLEQSLLDSLRENNVIEDYVDILSILQDKVEFAGVLSQDVVEYIWQNEVKPLGSVDAINAFIDDFPNCGESLFSEAIEEAVNILSETIPRSSSDPIIKERLGRKLYIEAVKAKESGDTYLFMEKYKLLTTDEYFSDTEVVFNLYRDSDMKEFFQTNFDRLIAQSEHSADNLIREVNRVVDAIGYNGELLNDLIGSNKNSIPTDADVWHQNHKFMMQQLHFDSHYRKGTVK